MLIYHFYKLFMLPALALLAAGIVSLTSTGGAVRGFVHETTTYIIPNKITSVEIRIILYRKMRISTLVTQQQPQYFCFYKNY